MVAPVGLDDVRAVVAAFRGGAITEDELVAAVVALPPVGRPPLPDAEWYDAVIVPDGPIAQLRRETYAGAIPADVYVRAVRAMVDAGHTS